MGYSKDLPQILTKFMQDSGV